MDALIDFLNDHRQYVYMAMGLAVVVAMMRALRRPPGRQQRENKRRLEDLKHNQKDRYRDPRPLR